MLFCSWQLKAIVYVLFVASSLGQELSRACERDYCYERVVERRAKDSHNFERRYLQLLHKDQNEREESGKRISERRSREGDWQSSPLSTENRRAIIDVTRRLDDRIDGHKNFNDRLENRDQAERYEALRHSDYKNRDEKSDGNREINSANNRLDRYENFREERESLNAVHNYHRIDEHSFVERESTPRYNGKSRRQMQPHRDFRFDDYNNRHSQRVVTRYFPEDSQSQQRQNERSLHDHRENLKQRELNNAREFQHIDEYSLQERKVTPRYNENHLNRVEERKSYRENRAREEINEYRDENEREKRNKRESLRRERVQEQRVNGNEREPINARSKNSHKERFESERFNRKAERDAARRSNSDYEEELNSNFRTFRHREDYERNLRKFHDEKEVVVLDPMQRHIENKERHQTLNNNDNREIQREYQHTITRANAREDELKQRSYRDSRTSYPRLPTAGQFGENERRSETYGRIEDNREEGHKTLQRADDRTQRYIRSSSETHRVQRQDSREDQYDNGSRLKDEEEQEERNQREVSHRSNEERENFLRKYSDSMQHRNDITWRTRNSRERVQERNVSRRLNVENTSRLREQQLEADHTSMSERRIISSMDKEYNRKQNVFVKSGSMVLGQGALLAYVIIKTINGKNDFKNHLPNKVRELLEIICF